MRHCHVWRGRIAPNIEVTDGVKIEGQQIIDLMRGCLTEMSASLKALRRETEGVDADALPVARNALLFSLDMNLAAMHMLGLRLMEGVGQGRVEISDSERVIIGMSASFMREPIGRLVQDALDGFAVPDERVLRERGGGAGEAPLH